MVTLKLPREKHDGSIGTEIGIAIGQVAGDGNSLIWADDPDNPDGLLLTLPDGTPNSLTQHELDIIAADHPKDPVLEPRRRLSGEVKIIDDTAVVADLRAYIRERDNLA